MCDIREQIVTSRRLWWWLEVWLSSLQERRKSYWVLLADTTTINIIIIMVIFLWSSCDIYMNESFFSFIFYVFKKYLFNGRRRAASSRPPPTEGHGDACNRRLHFCVVHWIKKNMYNIYHETPLEKKCILCSSNQKFCQNDFVFFTLDCSNSLYWRIKILFEVVVVQILKVYVYLCTYLNTRVKLNILYYTE